MSYIFIDMLGADLNWRNFAEKQRTALHVSILSVCSNHICSNHIMCNVHKVISFQTPDINGLKIKPTNWENQWKHCRWCYWKSELNLMRSSQRLLVIPFQSFFLSFISVLKFCQLLQKNWLYFPRVCTWRSLMENLSQELWKVESRPKCRPI